MARDDYFVVVYQILSYLYQKLKQGEAVDVKMISNHSPLMDINKKYWDYILINMIKDGYVNGAYIDSIDNYGEYIANLDAIQITPKGITYLCDNSTLEKAKKFVKEAKDFIIPFM